MLLAVLVLSCAPRPEVARPDGPTVVDAPSEVVAPASSVLSDAGTKTPASVGEECRRTGSAPGSGSPFQRPCASGLVCCVPPHGAKMVVEVAFCRSPCVPTPPSKKPAGEGCGADGCPWALVP
jgi:hypothetical protein